MNAETIIMLVFVVAIVIGLPTLLWLIERDKKREEEELRKGIKQK